MVKANGKKTAWMGTYYDQHGQERDVDPFTINANGERCPLVVLPDGREVPQVTSYTHLGTPLHSEWKHGMNDTRLKVVHKCRQLITLVGRIDVLGPQQLRKAIDLVVGGTIGYYGRATPLTFKNCEQIEQARRHVLAKRNICPDTPRLPAYLSQRHRGAWAHARVPMGSRRICGPDRQSHHGRSGRTGARQALAERIAMPLTLHPEHLQDSLSEDNLIEAWLLMRVRAKVRVNRPTTEL